MIIYPPSIPTPVNELGVLRFRCGSDDNPVVLEKQYAFISIPNFYASSLSLDSLIIMGNNLTRNLDNATYTCRSVSASGEVYETQHIPFRVLCKYDSVISLLHL